MNLSGRQLTGAAAGLAALGTVTMTATEAREWLDTFGTFVQHPSSVVILIILIAALLGWLFVRAAQQNEDCEQRVLGLHRQNAAQQTQLDAIHLLLSLDERYGACLPTLDEWRSGKFDTRCLAPSRKAGGSHG